MVVSLKVVSSCRQSGYEHCSELFGVLKTTLKSPEPEQAVQPYADPLPHGAGKQGPAQGRSVRCGYLDREVEMFSYLPIALTANLDY